jgi:Ca-activated chloride channel homolog
VSTSTGGGAGNPRPQIPDPISPRRSTATPPKRNRLPLILGAGIGLTVGAMLTAGAFVVVPQLGGRTCPERPALRVVTAPELSTVVNGAVDVLRSRDTACPLPISVTAEDPAVTAAALAAERGNRPDVWIPDSSIWAVRATKPGTGVPTDNPSIATSPVVLATPTRRPLSVADLVPAADTAAPVRWVLPAPETSAATVGGLIELQHVVAGRADGPSRFGSVVRTSRRDSVDLASLPAGTALPTTEQQVYAFRQAKPKHQLSITYARQGFRFDYPMIVLTPERVRRDRADDILHVLRSELGQQLLANAGFRGPDGSVSAALTAEFGAAANTATAAQSAGSAAVDSAIRAYTSIIRPSRLLAAIDVSGSMANTVPGTHSTRLDLAVQAAINGLAVYSDNTVVGVWEFATNLTPTTDYKVLAPLQALGSVGDGESGRQQIAQALSQIRPTRDRTGLNDTTLAAVREVRRHWDPKRVNSVVIISDGGNSDRNGISTPDLLKTLAAENDPERPVAVFAIAYGPSSDLASLQKISAVTGGRAYAAPDPRQISQVLADAIGRRSCTPDC